MIKNIIGIYLRHYGVTDPAIARRIERSYYNYSINLSNGEMPTLTYWDRGRFLDLYSNRCGIILNILNPRSDVGRVHGTKIAEKIKNGEIDVHTIGSKSEKDLLPEVFEEARSIIQDRLNQKITEKVSTMYKCPHCHAFKCTWIAVQRRALDEPVDIQCTCSNCGKRFRGY